MEKEKIKQTKDEKFDNEDKLQYKLYEETNKLKVVGDILQKLQLDEEDEDLKDERVEKLWGVELIVKEVAENIMKHRSKFLGV